MSADKKHVWHAQQEKILKEWSEISSSYRFMHDRAHGKFHTQNLWFALPVIVLSTVTGTANFAHEAFPDSWKDYVPLGIGFLNLTAGLITTIAQFLRVSEKMEGHRAASISYSKLARNIAVEYGRNNIRATCIYPGLIKTDFSRTLWENETILKSATDGSALKRIGMPDEIAGAPVFLASDAGTVPTGQNIVIDRGEGE